MQLYKDIGTTDTSITVGDAQITLASVPGVIQIESEKIHFQSCSNKNFFGCTRAFAGTSAATHAAGTAITSISTDNPVGTADMSGTAPVVVTGGAAVLPSAAAVSMHVTDTTHDGYMSSATFNVLKSWLGVLAADPGTPTEGQAWYNSTTHLLKFYDGTSIKVVATV